VALNKDRQNKGKAEYSS